MIRLSRMTDYGVVVMSQMARDRGAVATAPDLAEVTALPAPTVSKILKMLAKGGLVESRRGVNGGYVLTRRPEDISAAEIIAALDGPVALTACVDGAVGDCNVESLCPLRGGWDRVNAAIRTALESVSLADLYAPVLFPERAAVPGAARTELRAGEC